MGTAVSNNSGNWGDDIWDGGAGADGRPADGDAVTISAGHSVLMNSDLQAWTGLLTVTIESHATDPGMLYWKNGTDGYLKIRTGYNLVGTNAAAKGRLLANSDGIWGNTTALAFANKAVILLEGTSKIDATYLDIRTYCYEPTNKYVEVYKTAYTCTDQTTDIALATDIITFTGAPPAAGTAVCVRSSGTLPTPLRGDVIYYTRTVAGNTCKLATLNADANIVDITAVGTGTLTMYDGHTDTGTDTINVIQNVSSETGWTADAEHDAVVLCNWGPQAYDQQRLTMVAINAGSIQLSANIDSVQYPCARIYLSSRNISIRSSATTDVVIISTSVSGIFGCEIKNTAGTGTTFHGYAANVGLSNTFSGTLNGFSVAVFSMNNVVSGIILASGSAIGDYNSSTFSGTIAGCQIGISGVNRCSFSGTMFGLSYGWQNVNQGIFSGNILGCQYGINNTKYIFCKNGIINSCSYAIYSGDSCLFNGTLFSGNTYDFGMGNAQSTCRNTLNTNTPVIQGTNQPHFNGKMRYENYNRIDGVMKIYDCMGDIIKTACDGTGDAPSIDPDGGNGDCIEASNIQSNLYSASYPFGVLQIIEEQRIWLTAAAHTVTYKLQTTYAGITAGNLKLTCWYIGTNGVLTEITNAPAISQRADDTDWTQELSVTFTPSIEGWASFSIDLMEYESGCEVYVWPTPTIT